MPEESFFASDIAVLDLLRRDDSMTVAEIAEALEVTATAVRQRLTRLMAQGHVDRSSAKTGRGRPSHHYVLTAKGRRQAGENFMDLAMALWREVKAISDPKVRDSLIERLSSRLASMYADRVDGVTVSERMEAVANLFRQRQIPFEVDQSDGGPILKALACPYVDLADNDRSICAMERIMFSEMVGARVHSINCRLDGDRCCAFIAN